LVNQTANPCVRLKTLGPDQSVARRLVNLTRGATDWDAWLDPETGNPLLLQSMLAPCPDDWLECSPA
jgi:putative SOS response-associated peptidase YedK